MPRVHPVLPKLSGVDNDRPHVLTFTNICQSVKVRSRSPTSASGASVTPRSVRKTLDRVSGRAMPGQLTAIAGRSGAGKSTLLDIISGTVMEADDGTVYVNDVPIDQNQRRLNGYVPQVCCMHVANCQ